MSKERTRFDAPWWNLDQVALWIALRDSRLVEEAAGLLVCFADMLPDAPADDEAAIFRSASPVAGDTLLRDSPLLVDVGDREGEDHLRAVETDLRHHRGFGDSPLTLYSVLDVLARSLTAGNIVAAGLLDDAPTHRELKSEEWLSLQIQVEQSGPLSVRSKSGKSVREIQCRRDTVLKTCPFVSTLGTRAASPVGRPKDSGTYRGQDMPLVEEMRRYRLANPGVTVNAASIQFAPEAAGGGQPTSKARRLRNLYKKIYGET